MDSYAKIMQDGRELPQNADELKARLLELQERAALKAKLAKQASAAGMRQRVREGGEVVVDHSGGI